MWERQQFISRLLIYPSNNYWFFINWVTTTSHHQVMCTIGLLLLIFIMRNDPWPVRNVLLFVRNGRSLNIFRASFHSLFCETLIFLINVIIREEPYSFIVRARHKQRMVRTQLIGDISSLTNSEICFHLARLRVKWETVLMYLKKKYYREWLLYNI